MTSPVKLPPLPYVITYPMASVMDRIYTREQMIAYAEQAVRQALAAQEPVAYLNADALDRLRKPHVAGCAAAIEKMPRGGFVAIAIIPDADKDPPCSPTSSTGQSQ